MRTRAIVIKKQNTNEYDQLVTCYTQEFGKLTAVAKSILKNNSIQAMHLDLFNLVDFELIDSRSIPIIAGAQLENGYRHIKNNLSSLASAYFFTEVVDKMIFDNQKDIRLWFFITSLFEDLDNQTLVGGRNLKDFFRKKQLEFLTVLGYAPNLVECSRCSGITNDSCKAYSHELGGIICQNCFLSGSEGVLIKNNDILLADVIFQTIIGKKLASLSFMNFVVKYI